MPALKTRPPAKKRVARGPIVVDSFAGGGGASLGIEMAIGKSPHIAINHDQAAIEMHKANHPDTFHYTDDVWHVDPAKACQGRRVAFLWASPDCRHFSRAKGNKPVKKNIRGLAWVVVKWARAVQPGVIFLENVQEFQDWCPVMQLRKHGELKYDQHGKPRYVPDETRRGATFKRWVRELEKLDYVVEFRVLCAADYGVPTTRRRLFVIARRDGKPIVWPKPTHAKPDRNGRVPEGMLPWLPSAGCISWELVCPSIFCPKERKKYGLKPTLAPKTLKRIAMGVQRFVLQTPRPFIVRCGHGGEHFRGQDIDLPLATLTGSPEFSIVCPSLVANYGEREGQLPRTQDVADPLDTVVGVPKHSLQATFLSRYYGNSVGQDVRQPHPTESGCGHTGLAAAFLAKHYTGVVGTPVAAPLGTVTGVDHHSFVTASITKIRGNSPGHPISDPMPTVTSGAGAARPAGAAHALGMQAVSLVRLGQSGGNGAYVNSAEEPLTTVVSKAEHCLTTATLAQDHVGLQVNRFKKVFPFMKKFFGPPTQLDELTAFADDNKIPRYGVVDLLVKRKGKDVAEKAVIVLIRGLGLCLLTDIGLRMLQPRELARAQGFPDDYKLTGSKSNQVAKIGNSVPPPLVAQIVEANIGKRKRAVRRAG